MSYDNTSKRIPLCCEICMKDDKEFTSNAIKTAANKWLFSHGITITLGRHDPSKIVCKTLSSSCDYIVIEPAIPIKIVQEYNDNYGDSKISTGLTTTHYSIYDMCSYSKLKNNEANSWDKAKKKSTENKSSQQYYKDSDSANAKNEYGGQYMNADVMRNVKKRKTDFSHSQQTIAFPSTKKAMLQQNVNASSQEIGDIEEDKSKENENLLFTIPVIGEKSISSMEDDPIVLPNFCCVVHIVAYYKNDECIDHKINELYEEDEEEGTDEKKIPIYSQYVLPHIKFHKLWDSLYYEENIKKDLLEYVSALMLFAAKKIDSNLINYNRLILLYGPPGTGKTSLCKALANKICIRLSNIYTTGLLIELNTHSLFSKWFSESGKQVMKLFTRIKKIINDYEDNDIFICLLIDEVESLSSARKRAMDTTEPSDSIRVVNALLTQIDSFKYYHNTLLLTTSNITEMIDDAFIDRVDLKQFIGLPNEECRYEIYKGCIEEMAEKGIIDASTKMPSYQKIQKLLKGEECLHNENKKKDMQFTVGNQLLECAKMSNGFSGRCLRRIPFQAYAYFCQATLRLYNSLNSQSNISIPTDEFLVALKKAIQKENTNKHAMAQQQAEM